MAGTAELLETLLELPRPERARLAHWLIESLELTVDSSNAAATWSAELDERLAAVDRGELAEGTAADVLRRAREVLAQGSN